MPVVKRDQTVCSQGAQPQLSHHRRNGSQHLNFEWLQNLLETHSQAILLHLQNRTPFSRLIINQGFRLGNSCKNFFGYFSFFLLWSFWFQQENLKDSPSDSQLGKDMATFTVHLRRSGTPHLCEASQKTPICRVNMSPLVTRFCRWSRNGFLWRTEGWGHTHCLHFSLGWCTFSLKIVFGLFACLFVLCCFYVCFWNRVWPCSPGWPHLPFSGFSWPSSGITTLHWYIALKDQGSWSLFGNLS